MSRAGASSPLAAPELARRIGRRSRPERIAVGAALLTAVALASVAAPWLAPAPPLRQELAAALAGPSPAHPLGTDALGRDVLSRVLYGGRLSLAVGFIATLASLTVGAALGGAAGAAGGLVDEVVARAVDVFLAFPGILLAIALAAVLGPSPRNVVVALAVMGWPGYARLVRAQVRAAAALDAARAAEALGASPVRIAARHLLPTAAPAVAVQGAFGLSGAIVAEASLSFLGLGAAPPTPSWGAMLAEGRALLVVAPQLAIAPAAAIGITILGVQLLGDGLAARAAARAR